MKKTFLQLLLACSLTQLCACGQDIKQAVKVDAPKQTNSNNVATYSNSQSNLNSGNQSNQQNTSTGNQTNLNQQGSGSQQVNSGSGTQTNQSVTNTGQGTLIFPVNTGAGPQTNQINTGSGSITNVTGNQTINNQVIYNLAAPSKIQLSYDKKTTSTIENEESEKLVSVKLSWEAVEHATSYTVYIDDQKLESTSGLSVTIPADDFETDSRIHITANDGKQESPPSSEISIIPQTQMSGKIRDESGNVIDPVSIRATSLNSSVPYQASVSSSNGGYTFSKVPAGIMLEIIASKPGYATRRRVEVLGTSPQVIDFSSATALKGQPEVIAVEPGRNASGVSPETAFVLRFSEPMDTASVEEAFAVAAGADLQLASGSSLEPGNLIYDQSVFDISWNVDETEATFRFSDERHLPADASSRFKYQLSFSQAIRDSAGNSASGAVFKLTEGAAEAGYSFSIDTDDEAPEVVSIDAIADNSDGDAIQVEYSEPMALFTRAGLIAGGLDLGGSQNDASASPLNAQNYTVTVTRAGVPVASGTWASFGGRVIFDSDDDTHSSVLLILSDTQTDVYMPGDRVGIEVSASLRDPAGNAMQSGNTSEDDTAS